MGYEHFGQGQTWHEDGKVLCQICFDVRDKEDMAVAKMDGGYPSQWWDVCDASCAVNAGLKLGEDGVWR